MLVVDTDLRKPNIHKVLGCHNAEGVCQYLDKKKLLNDLVVPTAINKLFVLPAGDVPACPGDSVSFSGMGAFIKEIKRQFADYIIIFDSAPSHIAAGSKVIANSVDGILFVIMAQKFPRKGIERSIESLGREKILGVVLNGCTLAHRDYHKYYENYSKSN